mmetsp:Transcript_16192/g.19670  ORF Transcript_16192/g.19670 Transcript_16192/m.19670 type:complete len:98 (+) Transcript_16192:826-1119(+)
MSYTKMQSKERNFKTPQMKTLKVRLKKRISESFTDPEVDQLPTKVSWPEGRSMLACSLYSCFSVACGSLGPRILVPLSALSYISHAASYFNANKKVF